MTRKTAISIQQAILHFATATALATSAYVELLAEVERTTSPKRTLWQALAESTYPWVPLGASAMFVMLVLLVFVDEKFARRAAIVVAALTVVFYVLRICGAFTVASIFIFHPQSMLLLIIPGLFVWTAFRYSFTDTKQTVWEWMTSPDGASIVLKMAITGCIIVFAYFTWREFTVPEQVVRYDMSWEITSDRHCRDRVTLAFTNVPVYKIDVCSSSLRLHLQENTDDIATVELRRRYDWGTWQYQIERINGWAWDSSDARIRNPYASWTSDESSAGGEFPLHQPFEFQQ